MKTILAILATLGFFISGMALSVMAYLIFIVLTTEQPHKDVLTITLTTTCLGVIFTISTYYMIKLTRD